MIYSIKRNRKSTQVYTNDFHRKPISVELCVTLWNSVKQLNYLNIIAFALMIFFSNNLLAQESLYYNYYPTDIHQTDWKFSGHLYYETHNNSDQLTNEFAQAIHNSEYLSADFKEKQINLLEGSSKVGRISNAALGAWIRRENLSFYLGMDFQQILDGQIDEDLTKLMLMGNAPYAGQLLSFEETQNMNVYFNRFKLGLSKTIDQKDIQHTFSGFAAFTAGQNYNYTELSSGSAFTQENGEYLDLGVIAETQMSDTVWGDLFTFAGYGASLDLNYSLLLKENFFLSFGVQNLGFISWSKSPYQASADTSIHFSGINTNDSTSIPNNFSESSLRNLIFKDVDASSFSKILPYHLNLSVGKFLAQSKLYIGISATYYPSLNAPFRAEFFGSYNIHHLFRITPIVSYSSFNKVNFGLAAEANIKDHFYIRAGSSYLNSTFDKEAPAGQGFFLSLVFRN